MMDSKIFSRYGREHHHTTNSTELDISGVSNSSSQSSIYHGTASTMTSFDSNDATIALMLLKPETQASSAERWTSLASLLQIRVTPERIPTLEAHRCAHAISRSHRNVNKQTFDTIQTLFSSLAKPFLPLRIATNASFNRDAVPLELPDLEGRKPSKINLSTPEPFITIGYTQAIFDPHLWELQQGIISDRSGEPRNLGRIAQTVPGTYWPFFVVDIQSDGLFQARNVCASSTATCNNSLMLLAAAIYHPLPTECDGSFFANLSKAVNSFSLAVNGESACLIVHKAVGPLATAVETIGEYKLGNAKDMEELASRISSIYAWACYIRLPAIIAVLDKLDARVQFRETITNSSERKNTAKRPFSLKVNRMPAFQNTSKIFHRKEFVKSIVERRIAAPMQIPV